MFVNYKTCLQVNICIHIEAKSKHSTKIMSIPSMRIKQRQFYSTCKISLNIYINMLRQIKNVLIVT